MARFLFYDDKIINILLQEEKPSGGAAVQTYAWMMGMLQNNQQVTLLTSKTNETLKPRIPFKILPLYDQKRGLTWIRWIYYRLPYFFKIIKREQPDFFYQSIPHWSSFFLSIICRTLKIKYLLRISNDIIVDDRFLRKNFLLHKLLINWSFKLCGAVICQNEYQYSKLLKKLPKQKVLKIGNPIIIDVPIVDKQIRENYIAWIGIFQYQKNIPLLYQIASTLSNQQFRIAGKESSKFDSETLLYLNKLKGLDNVEFVGFLKRNEVSNFLSEAKFLVNTSHYEGFSNTFLEAMLSCTPIITSVNVNPDNLISKYELGIVYRSVEDLHKQLDELNKKQYNIFKININKYIMEHDSKIISSKLLNFLNLSPAKEN